MTIEEWFEKILPVFIENLRSGKYQQGRDRLCKKVNNNTFEYCCLGVYSSLAKSNNWTKSEIKITDLAGNIHFNEEDIALNTVLVTELPWNGFLLMSNEEMLNVGVQKSYIDLYREKISDQYFGIGGSVMNDSGVSFNQIADFLEKLPERYNSLNESEKYKFNILSFYEDAEL